MEKAHMKRKVLQRAPLYDIQSCGTHLGPPLLTADPFTLSYPYDLSFHYHQTSVHCWIKSLKIL